MHDNHETKRRMPLNQHKLVEHIDYLESNKKTKSILAMYMEKKNSYMLYKILGVVVLIERKHCFVKSFMDPFQYLFFPYH